MRDETEMRQYFLGLRGEELDGVLSKGDNVTDPGQFKGFGLGGIGGVLVTVTQLT